MVDENRVEGLARQASGKVQSTLGDITGDTKSQAQGRIDDVMGKAQRTYGRAKDSVRNAASQVTDSTGDYAGSMLDQIEEYGDYVAEQIDERPITSVLIAASIGFLIALVTRPSRKVVYRRR